MENGIGLDVIKYSRACPNLFSFKWYSPQTQTQQLKCYTELWYRYYKDTRAMYIPFKYKDVYQIIHNEEFRL